MAVDPVRNRLFVADSFGHQVKWCGVEAMARTLRKPLPEYTVTGISGEAHAQSFRVECAVRDVDVEPSQGEGSSRRQAEQDAADRMLARLEND